ncbi:hypothetical protein DHEL01_v207653 [Diaporthe helianthi]|uniref:Uncharacterized protein n=1 Tax=Diaporthe helianthi TaxID=158607 RepID=A0A2P5HUL0_DIAHE|nr:hypothetical protein DHEL01_v207653 [Diaporthe helianthi]
MMMLRITDEMREHMFDNFSEQTLQSMADFEESTIAEVKERLLEFAASHGLDSLDGPGDKAIDASQLDGATVDGDMLNAPQTPTLSHCSDDESIFDRGASIFTSPVTPFTTAGVDITDNGSPVKQGNGTSDQQLMCQTDGPDEFPETPDFIQTPSPYKFAPDLSNNPMIRLFDPKNSLKHQALDMDSLVAFNPNKQVVHLQGVDPLTGCLQSDLTTLVISIESVMYKDQQAGAAVFFHPVSPWNTVSWVDGTKKNAKLEALYIALSMISLAATNDTNLKTVLIKCAGSDFCLAKSTQVDHMDRDDTQTILDWLRGASQTTFEEIHDLWADITSGANGQRAVDVRLWCVPEEEMQTVKDMSLAYMYKQRGRNWWAENGKTPPQYQVQEPDSSMAYLQQHAIVTPNHVVSQGPQAVSRWRAETDARLRQCILHRDTAAEACRDLNMQLRDSKNGGLKSFEQFLDAYALATRYMSEDAQKHIDQFVEEQRAIRRNTQLQGRQVVNFGATRCEGAGTAGNAWAETLVQEVLEMDWEMD